MSTSRIKTPTSRIKITKSFVDSVPLAEKGEQVIYRDSELIGFALRVTSIKVYLAERKMNGRPVRVKLGVHGVITPTQARDLAREKLGLMAQGINPNEQKAESAEERENQRQLSSQQPTLTEVYEVYKVERKLSLKTLEDYDSCVNDYFKDWKDTKLIDISSKMVQDRHKKLTLRSEARANLGMRFLRAIFNFAMGEYVDAEDNSIIPSNPVRTLTTKKAWNAVKRRKGHVSDEQLPDWVDGLIKFRARGEQNQNQYAYTSQDFMFTLILTGFRRDEGESLRWDTGIDLKYGTITARDTKNGEDNTLPMGDVLWQIMRDRWSRNQGSEYVFPAKRSETGHIVNRSKARIKVSEETGIQFTYHDLRRTFGTNAENLAIGQYTIKRLINHTIDERDVTGGYVQVSMKQLRIAMNMLEDVVLSASARQALALRAEVLSTKTPSK